MKPYYERESVTLYCGDCREILPTLEPVDLLLTDPPYGISADKGASAGGTDASGRYIRRPKQYSDDWDDERPDAITFCLMVKSAKFAVIWGGNYFADILPQGGRWLFWDKLNSMPSYSDGEMAWTNFRGVSCKKFTQCNNGLASLKDGVRFHPTQKPVALMAWCLGFAPDAKTVLDPFTGSGTTGVACIRTGRQFIGIELEEKYCEIAAQRFERELNQGQLFEPAAIEPRQLSITEAAP